MISRYKTFISLILCVNLFISTVSASDAIKEALEEHLKDAAHNEGSEAIKHDKEKGEKIHDVQSQISDTHKNHFSKANDEAKYLKKDHDTKSSSDNDAYEGYNSKQDKAEDSHATGYKRGHKKGHHKQGFQNSYHKDESSNKSTFFDDLNDEGDQAAYNSRVNNHDNQGGRSYHGSHNNGQEYVRDNHQGGGYTRHGDVGNKNINHQDYGKKYYLDDNLNQNKYKNDRTQYNRDRVHDYYKQKVPTPVHHDPGWDWQKWDTNRRGWERDPGWESDPGWQRDQGWQRDPGWQRDQDWRRGQGWQSDRGWQADPEWNRDPGWRRDRGWERDYGGPGYYDDLGLRHDGGYGYGPNHGYGYGESRNDPVAEVPKSAPVVAHRKQTITIYEDPRYDGKEKGKLRREEGDYLELEFKPSSQRYASYDDSYYNAVPNREGAVESSKINRLVYNYRRH